MPPITGDFDGDGITDVSIYRPSAGQWHIRYSSTSTGVAYNLGGFGFDYPRAADFDGDGKTDLALWRPFDGVWYIFYASSGYTSTSPVAFGMVGDLPMSNTLPDTPCQMTVSATRLSTWPSSKTGTFGITTAPAGCVWSVTSDSPWLTITSGTWGSGNGTVTFSTSNNLTAADRTGHLSVTNGSGPSPSSRSLIRRRWTMTATATRIRQCSGFRR
jgi:hypothetical protein